MVQNPYRILGVPEGASVAECTKAYKRLAKKYHPDLNPGNKEAERKMSEINAAYDAIKNGTAASSSSASSGASSAGASTQTKYYQAVVNFINHAQYAQAINLLNQMEKSDGRWYYLSALANMGYGNRDKAMSHIKIAVSREPGNQYYRQAYESISHGINPMGFGFDFSSYASGAQGGENRTVYVRRKTGFFGRLLRFFMILILIRLVIWGITSLFSWTNQRYDDYYAVPTPSYGYNESTTEESENSDGYYYNGDGSDRYGNSGDYNNYGYYDDYGNYSNYSGQNGNYEEGDASSHFGESSGQTAGA